MRERGQASVETIALIAVALAVAAALLLGVVGVAPPLTATLVQALSGIFAPAAPGSPRSPGLDPLEGALLAAATSPDEDGPTLRDVRTHLRARLGRHAGDAAFAATMRPLITSLLPSGIGAAKPETFAFVDDDTEVAWLKAKLHPGRLKRLAEFTFGFAGVAGGAYSVLGDLGLLDTDAPDGVPAGSAAGDLVVGFAGGGSLIFRRRAGSGLTLFVPAL